MLSFVSFRLIVLSKLFTGVVSIVEFSTRITSVLDRFASAIYIAHEHLYLKTYGVSDPFLEDTGENSYIETTLRLVELEKEKDDT